MTGVPVLQDTHKQIEQNLWDMAQDKVISWDEYLFRMGRLHGYPKCCILYFMANWEDESDNMYQEDKYGVIPIGVPYIQCIKCRTQLEVYRGKTQDSNRDS